MISNEVFAASLRCRRKAFFKQAGQAGEVAEIEAVLLDLDRAYLRSALEWFLARQQGAEVLRDPPSLEAAIQGGAPFIVGATAQAGNLTSHLDVLERVQEGDKDPAYAPVLFVRSAKVTREDRLLLGFQALALSGVQGALPSVGKIVCGPARRVARVRLGPLVQEARRLVTLVEEDARGDAAPALTLNRHCAACEFRKGCQAQAEQTDDISLLRCLSEKEVVQQRARGVTTLTQFSHTYRPGRRGKKHQEGKARKHDPALQALALRQKKVYVLDAPALSPPPVALYLDLEGVPERDFCYLVGLLVVQGERSTFHSFWADDDTQERGIWDSCRQVIEGFPDYTLHHYGQYETRFLERLKKGAQEEAAAAIDGVLARSCNVLAAIHSHVYFPARSNGLKDIAGLLGFRWSAEGASGLNSLAWRLRWEEGKEEALKQRLLLYNQEDCLALRRVTEFLLSLCAGAPAGSGDGQPPVAQADDLQRPGTFRAGKSTFFCPELERINQCAYSDYQREKVYVRTSPSVRRSQRRKLREAKRPLKVNQDVECSKPEECPACGSPQVGERSHFPTHLYRKILLDLRFTATGVKTWLVRYASLRYQCGSCQATFLANDYPVARAKFGRNLSAWAVYHHVALRQSHEDVVRSLDDIFGFSFCGSVLSGMKLRLAELYRPAYEKMKEKLRGGPLAHADETRALVKRHRGYVWAFTNLEEVVYAYTPTRDGDILGEVLRGFTGVLVSDFYSAYDGVNCPQQKCLIHLMRDVNDDLFHNPFDEELKEVAQKLVGVLKPVIDTIDAHGLKRHFLHKHRKEADAFLRYLEGAEFHSELARHYQKRVGKYKEKLFTFLDHDGVPWNNNNAEVAIKGFASRRRIMGASFTEKGIADYLIFLSLYQTCRNKNVSFLRFLRSGALDLDAFADSQGRR